MDMLLQQLATLGLGGIVAGLVLIWKRSDDTARLKEKEEHAHEIAAMFARLELRDKMSMEIVQANTAALVALQTTVAQLGALKELNDRIAEMERRRGGRGA